MKISKDLLIDILYDTMEGKIEDKIFQTTRWSSHHEMVFKYNNKLYSVKYSKGLTEQQNELPFEYDGTLIECTEVTPVEVVSTKYIRKFTDIRESI